MRALPSSALAALLAASALSSPASGGEACMTAELRNGFTISFTRSQALGSDTRLWLCGQNAGYVEIASDQIESVQPGEPSPPAAVPVRAAPAAPVSKPADALPSRDSIEHLIANAASRHQIDRDFLSSVVKAESGFNPGAVSSKGARGLMQLMPDTAAGLGVRDAFDPATNVEAGTKFLRELLDLYGGDAVKALAAYNAGPQRVEQYGGVPPYAETRTYINRIISEFNRKKLEAAANNSR
jgi:soluble lytic murein transglycosylase-like protein